VWTGSDAIDNGLIDEIGDMNAAITAAAELAELEEGEYGKKYFEKELSPGERLILDLLGGAKWLGFNPDGLAKTNSSIKHAKTNSSIKQVANILEDAITPLFRMNDPKGVYAHCFCVFE
jgi:protease-4